MLGRLWPLSLPAGPSFSNLIGPFSPIRLTFQSASRMACGSARLAIRIASAIVATPSWPRKPSVSPSNGLPRLVHSSTNAFARFGSGIASGNHGMKKTMWYESSAAAVGVTRHEIGLPDAECAQVFLQAERLHLARRADAEDPRVAPLRDRRGARGLDDHRHAVLLELRHRRERHRAAPGAHQDGHLVARDELLG